jgi:hypothetical protein
MAGYAAYDGEFADFDSATQVAATAGDGVAASARVYVDEHGAPIAQGVAVGLGGGVSVSVTRSESIAFFPACPQRN